ncbi:hypothetical protein APHAL10511_001858 [Amanita phalloides]|nr:hypothetical protein APHAL10511_001858 [Amanita phalloides]
MVLKSSSASALSAQTDIPNSPAKAFATYASGVKPDKQVYEEEQGRIKAEIDALQNKLLAVRDKIALATTSGPGNDGEAALRSELNDIKARQSSSKTSRSQILDQIKSLQENIQKKDLQSARSKLPFRTVEEVDAHIRDLEKQVESGQMKLVDEKRALAQISNSKRARRLVEGFQSDQQKFEEDRRAIEELKQQLDDPEAKAINDRYDAIIAELDEFKAKRDEAYAGKSKLFEERDSLQAEMRALHNEKRESIHRFREANDNYWAKINEDKARREERRRAQRDADEQQRKRDTAERLLEEANAPAYQTEIEDCQTLIDHFSGKASNSDMTKTTSQKAPLAGVRQLELRTVDGEPEGVVIRKKGDKEESYFVGGKGRGKGKKNAPKVIEGNGVPSAAGSTNASLHIPLSILSALGTLSIPPPTSSADVPRVIEDLKTKKLWLEANQIRATADRIEKAEAEVKLLLNGMGQANGSEIILPQEIPAEPAPTPRVDNSLQDNTLSDETVNKLDTILEHEATVDAP